jgi:hypothetical protein
MAHIHVLAIFRSDTDILDAQNQPHGIHLQHERSGPEDAFSLITDSAPIES